MNMTKDKKDRIVYVLFFASMALVLTLVIWAGNFRLRPIIVAGGEPVAIPKNWTLFLNGVERGTVSLPVQAAARPNEPVELQHVIPYVTEEGTAVAFHTSFASVQVYAGDTLLYENDSLFRRPFGKSTPSGWNIVKVPNEYNGEILKIRVQSPYPQYSGELTGVWMGELLALTGHLIGKYLPQLLSCGAFILLGTGLIISSVILCKILQDVCTLRCLGIFIVMASLWMMSEIDFPDILWDASFMMFMARYLLAMACPLPYLMYLLHHFPERYSPCFRALAVAFSLNLFALTTLQILDIADFAETIWVTHILILVLFCCMAVILFMRVRRERPVTFYFMLECIGILALAVCILVEIYLYHRKEYMRNGEFLQFGMCVYTGCLFAALLLDILKKREVAEKIGRELQESRLRLMISQIQPHFIYNTLNSIRTLIKLSPDQAYDLVYDFSKYLRANIDAIGREGLISFSKELEHIKSYCNIEQIRFGKKLTVLYEIEEDQFPVPPLSIQPLVENAITHGIRGKSGSGTVKIHSFKRGKVYVVEVLDDGAGFDMDMERTSGSAGIENIRIRLKELVDSILIITSIPGKGTKAVVMVPEEAGWGSGLSGYGGNEYEDDSCG